MGARDFSTPTNRLSHLGSFSVQGSLGAEPTCCDAVAQSEHAVVGVDRCDDQMITLLVVEHVILRSWQSSLDGAMVSTSLAEVGWVWAER